MIEIKSKRYMLSAVSVTILIYYFKMMDEIVWLKIESFQIKIIKGHTLISQVSQLLMMKITMHQLIF